MTLIRRNFRTLLKFEVIYKILSLVLFFPSLIYLQRLLLIANRVTVIATYNFKAMMLNPLSWLIIFLIVVLVCLYVAIEQFSWISIFHASASNEKVTVKEVLNSGVDLMVNNFRFGNWELILYFLIIYPFCSLVDSSNITRFITVPGFILEHFEKYPVYGHMYQAASILMMLIGMVICHSLIIMAVEKKSFKDACIEDWQFNKGLKIFRVLFKLAKSIVLGFLIVIGGTVGFCILTYLVVLWLEGAVVFDNLFTDDFLIITTIMTEMFYAWMMSWVTSAVIFGDYVDVKEASGEMIPVYEKKKHILEIKPLQILCIVLSCARMFFSIPSRYRQFKWVMNGRTSNTLIMAHRGYSAVAPENTIPAFKAAADCGATAIELDVQMTKDGEIIVLHDDSLSRTAGLDKHVWEVTYDEIRNLDNVSFFSEEFTGTNIPTLDEAIEFCKDKLYINIEIKRTGHDDGICDKVVEIIRAHNFQNECDITSMDYETL